MGSQIRLWLPYGIFHAISIKFGEIESRWYTRIPKGRLLRGLNLSDYGLKSEIAVVVPFLIFVTVDFRHLTVTPIPSIVDIPEDQDHNIDDHHFLFRPSLIRL